jgi:hypothetical protein
METKKHPGLRELITIAAGIYPSDTHTRCPLKTPTEFGIILVTVYRRYTF